MSDHYLDFMGNKIVVGSLVILATSGGGLSLGRITKITPTVHYGHDDVTVKWQGIRIPDSYDRACGRTEPWLSGEREINHRQTVSYGQALLPPGVLELR